MIERRKLLETVAFVSCVAFISTVVQADGMPRGRAMTYAAPTSWTGLYLGINAGAAWSDAGLGFSGNDPIFQSAFAGTAFTGGTAFGRPGDLDRTGFTGGIQAGYNWQVAPTWVIGFEADINSTDLDDRSSSTGLITTGPPVATGTVRGSQDINWFGTLRGRIGVLPAPNVMLYATGGLAYGHVREAASFSVDSPGGLNSGGFSIQCPVANVACAVGSSSDTRVGWTLGGGAEFLVTRNVTFKAEYLYVNLGDDGVAAVATSPTAGLTAASFRTSFGDAEIHTVRLGLNYKFGGDCCAAPLK
jgi:outer membrane immunogenic protein